MSAGKALPLADAAAVANELRELLAPACERIEIAGSIRRERPGVRDLELVAIPAMRDADGGDLWGTQVQIDMLEQRLSELFVLNELAHRQVEVKRANGSTEWQTRDGSAYKALAFREMPVDLFIVRPGETDWGVIFTIRTGPAEFSHRLVTDCQRYLRRVEKGRLYRSGAYVPCPEEQDFFRAIGQPWVEPAERSAASVRIQARVA